MENETEQDPKAKMEHLRSICDGRIPEQQQIIDSFTASFATSLNFIKALALDTAQNHAKLAKMKANLREAEDELVKVLAAKTRKEAKQMDTRDSISAIKARVEKLKRTVQVQRARRDEYGSIISQESIALTKIEEKVKHEIEENGEIHEAISWYNRVLGFHIESGHGVKFTFNDVNTENPKQEYSFTIRHANDAYSLLECDPPLNGIQELINELNRTNGLFKFVRIMREKFQEAAAIGLQPQSTSFHQGSSAISMSGPALSVSTARSESSTKKNEHHIPIQEVNGPVKEVNHRSKSPAKTNGNKIYDGRFNRQPKKPNQIFNCRSPLLEAKK
ncbi:hypothetical protein HRI_003307600 [Hibiscus trionum]|uniref:Kinetochore protein SPC25 n=1 Tax=Hibiscus trionum TaxID=183268 RepID=A0A9W7ILP6_HIBTR|nr:hypothetical protein HRI_003307600 [Hibiscus trionum]